MSDAVDALRNKALAAMDEFGYPELKESPKYQSHVKFNKLMEQYTATTDDVDKELLLESIIACQAEITYGAMDPKTVPTSVMQFVWKSRYANSPVEHRAFEAIKNPNTGIRAFCLSCMGGQQTEVRNCPSFNCPLWPFRMATNPFYGRLVGTDAEADATDPEGIT